MNMDLRDSRQPEYKLHRIDFHSKRNGAQVFLIVPATDAFTLIDQLRFLLFAEDCEYVLDGVRILGDKAPDAPGDVGGVKRDRPVFV